MKFTAAAAAACLSLFSQVASAAFAPPQVFKNANLVHVISLEKNLPKETINVVVENISPDAQDEYYLPFATEQMAKIGGFEVKDKKDADVVGFAIDTVEDLTSDTQYYRIRLPSPLASKAQQTLSITFYQLGSLAPLPAKIEQDQKQYLVYLFSAYCPSAYPTSKQKTELKFPSADIPEFTKMEDKELSQKSGTKVIYGPFSDEVPAGAESPARVRFEATRAVNHVSTLERDIEVSHWGGNVAFEERYTLWNHGANLTSQFNRVKFAQSQYFNPTSSALKEMVIPLRGGSEDVYFTDAIGNVTTSRFRSGKDKAHLEIKPRYPVFGGWKYPFTIGWNADAKNFLKKTAGDSYILKVPFLEGPKQPEGMEYGEAVIRVILPEGAENVKFFTTIPETSIVESIVDLHKTYLDTVGRTVLTIKAKNLVDDLRQRDLLITYDYSLMASLRKPFVIFSSVMTAFVGIWAISKVDVKFSAK